MPRRSAPDFEYIKVGNRIRELRLERGLSMTALAELAGMSKGHISGIEAGYHAINLKTINALAEAFNVEPMYLLVEPAHNDRQHAAELLRSLPLTEVRNVRKQIHWMLNRSWYE